MSFLKKLFGVGASGASKALPERSETYEGFEIRATPYEEEGKYQLCGVISREVDGVRREHRYVRADRFSTVDDAIEMTRRASGCLRVGSRRLEALGSRQS